MGTSPANGMKRRRLQYRIRTLLLIGVCATLPFAWLGFEIQQRRQERPTLELIESLEGEVATRPHALFGETAVEVELPWCDLDDLSPFANLRNLESLTIRQSEVRDLSALVGLKKLHSINVMSSPVADLTPLARMTQLRALLVDSRSDSPLDLTPLRSLRNLEILRVGGQPEIRNICVLRQLKNLEWVDLSGTAVDDLSAFSSLPRLKYLSLNGTNVVDLRPLSNLESLEGIDLSFTSVRDLKPLHPLKGLTDVKLMATIVTADEVARLRAALPGCKVLYVRDPRRASLLSYPAWNDRITDLCLSPGRYYANRDGPHVRGLESFRPAAARWPEHYDSWLDVVSDGKQHS